MKNRFLDELRKVPIVQVACERTGISRQTAYRWRQEDFQFAEEWDKALAEGEALIGDMAESQLLQLIKERNFSALRYWLDRRHKKYKRPPDPEPTPQEKLDQKYGHLGKDDIHSLLKEKQEEIKKLLEEDDDK